MVVRGAKLAGGRSPRWAFMDRFEVPQYDGVGIYLTRWRVIQTPWIGLLLHRMTGPDPRRTLHDHPWRFLSIVLRGGYTERRLNPLTMQVDEGHHIKRCNRVSMEDAHAIVALDRNPTWTLVLTGKRVRTWGYLEGPDLVDGSWEWTEFDKHRHNDEFLAAQARRRAV